MLSELQLHLKKKVVNEYSFLSWQTLIKWKQTDQQPDEKTCKWNKSCEYNSVVPETNSRITLFPTYFNLQRIPNHENEFVLNNFSP